jgi:hypothetical protein
MKTQYFIILLLLFQSCNTAVAVKQNTDSTSKRERAKFEPADGECLFFIGQDIEATGGLNGYSDYQNSLMAIGLSLVNHEKAIAEGKHDHLIREFGQWIKNSRRPVFLRIGYEFDGWSWNNYNRKYYLLAWRRIYDLFEEMGVENIAFVWQSKGTDSGQKTLEKWYPGDDLVDWCGYSYFGNPDEEMLTFARKHNKPVFIAEATPVSQTENLYFNADLSEPEVAERVWESWFVPFLNTLNIGCTIGRKKFIAFFTFF